MSSVYVYRTLDSARYSAHPGWAESGTGHGSRRQKVAHHGGFGSNLFFFLLLALPAETAVHPVSSPQKSFVGGIATASTPNLNTLYSAHSRLTPAAGSLARKASLAALTPGSLASIPDDTESYALHTVLNEPTSAHKMPPMPPLTPGRGMGPIDDFTVGDQVDVPGNMVGTVRFVGSVAGRKGVFAGVELHSEYAVRGKNSGDVDGYVA
ncbi:hypothetical protein NPX13_g5309 [Xylaria arbuscula]|uniref:CAP-Gly domain-containing protein n=1 Tax=Xylaria arbuscula TaxID=114810 RepID=A0A9W8NEE0_9PEZI|nr:hypothetical protein NPX13_g5309 [Xylaria arbuscula]